MDSEFRLNQFMDNVIECDVLDETFAGFTKNTIESDKMSRQILQDNLVKILQNVPPEMMENVIQFFVKRVSKIVNYSISRMLFEVLEAAILTMSHPAVSELVLPKILCHCIVVSHDFDLHNEVFWVNGLQSIQRNVKLINYKSIRDTLGFLLSKTAQISMKPRANSTSRQINALYKVLEYMFDRDTSLLPAYLILDEVMKKAVMIKWSKNNWKFSKLVAAFIDSFRPVADMVSFHGRPPTFPIVGHSLAATIIKLDNATGKYKHKGQLPYDMDLEEPQMDLLYFIMEQNHSRETIAHMLSFSKTKERSVILEKLLVEMIVRTIVKCGQMKFTMENDNFEKYNLENCDTETHQMFLQWQNVASSSIYYEFCYQNIHFPSFLNDLAGRLQELQSREKTNQYLIKSREFFMWTLLQMLSRYIPKHPFDNLLSIFRMYDMLYPETTAVPLPDLDKINCIYILSAASSWILLSIKAEHDKVRFNRTPPIGLEEHIKFLQGLISNPSFTPSNDFIVVLLCNTCMANTERYTAAFRFLENMLGSRSTPGALQQPRNQGPIAMNFLDSIAVHSRFNLTTHIMTHFNNLAQSKSQQPLSSGVVETYSRMMSYTENEQLSIKTFLNQLLPTVLRYHCWNYLLNFLEMFSYRLHRVGCFTRLQILRNVLSKTIFSQMNNVQLYGCIENMALKNINGFNSIDFLNLSAQMLRNNFEVLNFLPIESEELYKVYVLTLSRAIHITGMEALSVSWAIDIIANMRNTLNLNLSWPEFTMNCLPLQVAKFYQDNYQQQPSNKTEFRLAVDEEYRKWKAMTNEGDLVKHFSAPGALFYCVLYKLALDSETITPVVYQILDRIGVRGQIMQMRTFIECLVDVYSTLTKQQSPQIYTALSNLIWKYNIIPLERLLLCLALRHFESDSDQQICFYIIYQLLRSDKDVPNIELTSRVRDFVKDNSPEHWKYSNWAEKHAAYHSQYPEEFYFKHLQEASVQGNANATTLQPMFSNLCLRLLPIFDVIIHRIIEIGPSPKTLNVSVSEAVAHSILTVNGALYKFHDQPIMYLYNTLHYYDINLRVKNTIKRKLVYAIYNALKEVRGRNWAFTEKFISMEARSEEEDWKLDDKYYLALIGRVVETMKDHLKCPLSPTDYRFNEFPNAHSHIVYVTCVELMALPCKASDVGNALLNVVLNNHQGLPREDIDLWINGIAMVLASLPDGFTAAINDRIIELLKNPAALAGLNIQQLADFKNNHHYVNECEISYLMAIVYVFWSHDAIGRVCIVHKFLKERVKPIIQTEEQYLFICYLVGPLLNRLCNERTRTVMDITVELYEMLEIIDKKIARFNYFDNICDLMYHLKYMFTGNHIIKEIEGPIGRLRPQYLHKLRFITNTTITNTEPADAAEAVQREALNGGTDGNNNTGVAGVARF